MSAPFLSLVVCFAAGILAGTVVQVQPAVPPAVACLALLSLRAPSFRVALMAQFFFILVVSTAISNRQETRYQCNELRQRVSSAGREVLLLQGMIQRTPEIANDYFVLQISVDALSGAPVKGLARVTVSGQLKQPLIAGDRIETFARLRLPSNFRADGSFNYERYLKKEGVHVLGSVKSDLLIHKTGESWSVRRITSSIRTRWIRDISKTFSARDAGLLRALWLDDRIGLARETEQILMDSGVFHVIAISGFHLTVLVLLLFWLLKRLVSFRTAVLISSVLLVFYFLVLEGRASVTRSICSFLIFAFAVWKYERMPRANWIGMSAFVQLALNPLELFDSGFHLTYLSTSAILFLAVPVCRALGQLPGIYRYPADFLVTGFIVQCVLIPYQIYVFHRLPVFTFIANIVAVPVSSLLIALGMVLTPLGTLAGFAREVVRIPLDLFLGSSELFAEGVRIVRSPSVFTVIGFYFVAACMVIVPQRVWKAACGTVCLLLLIVCVFPFALKKSGSFRVHFLDVGQGDSILLEYPDGTFDLVDGGGFFNPEALDTGQAILLPYLSRKGAVRLHRVFLTHAHADHMNGLASVFKYIPVDEFYVTREPVGETGYQRLIQHIALTPRPIFKGKKFNQGNVVLNVLAPADTQKTLRVANDDSLVLLIEHKGYRVLLTGDMESRTELQIAEVPFRIDYIKVPHHGSKSSSSPFLLDRIRPKGAIVSAGANNWFGHPHPDIVQNYRKRHCQLYRTDLHGTIVLEIGPDGASLVN